MHANCMVVVASYNTLDERGRRVDELIAGMDDVLMFHFGI